MWYKLRVKSFTLLRATLGRILNHSCLVWKCAVCLLKHWVATQQCLPYCCLWRRSRFVVICYTHTHTHTHSHSHPHTHKELYFSWNFLLLDPSCKGKDDSLLVLGQTRVSRKNPVVALFPVAMNDTRREMRFLVQGISLCNMEQWPSLRQDQGITLNPPDRCHMHARAHKLPEKQKWWRGSKKGRKKTKKTPHTFTHTKLSALLILLHQCLCAECTYGAVSCKVSNYAHGILFCMIAS